MWLFAFFNGQGYQIQMGYPSSLIPLTDSFLSVYFFMHFFSVEELLALIYWMGDNPFMDVSITLLSCLIRKPISWHNSSKYLQKYKQSSKGMTTFRSSVYTRRLEIPPSLSSSSIPLSLRYYAPLRYEINLFQREYYRPFKKFFHDLWFLWKYKIP